MKQIAPYLPYNVQIEVTDTFMDMDTYETIEETYITTLDTRRLDYFKEDIKLILRPLSDLTKEIEHNGEKFVPIDYFLGEDSDLVYNACLIHNDFSYLPYNLVQLLLEWHFDIFALIEKGLAIDINTLNK